MVVLYYYGELSLFLLDWECNRVTKSRRKREKNEKSESFRKKKIN